MPSMVSLPERTTLRDWVAFNWMGFGDIVEIGAFVGSSAVAIMQGMEMTRNPGKLHVYDTFKFPQGGHEETYRSLVGIKGDSFRTVFNGITRQWSDRLVVNEGDAALAKWTGGKIEFLHIDCSISREFHEQIALEFYPHLTPQATLVHQDYSYERAPFIAEMMAKLSPWFQRLGQIETTAYFTRSGKFTREDIERALQPQIAEAA